LWVFSFERRSRRNKAWTILQKLAQKQILIVTRRKCNDFEPIGVSIDHRQSLSSNRSSRSENRNASTPV